MYSFYSNATRYEFVLLISEALKSQTNRIESICPHKASTYLRTRIYVQNAQTNEVHDRKIINF